MTFKTSKNTCVNQTLGIQSISVNANKLLLLVGDGVGVGGDTNAMTDLHIVQTGLN